MPPLAIEIPNLVGGISQQSPTLRLPTQAEEQLNGFSSTADGLTKRPPAEYLNRVPARTGSFHRLFRVGGEPFLLNVAKAAAPSTQVLPGIREIADVGEGQPNGNLPLDNQGTGLYDYLQTTGDPEDSIRVVTVGRTIFIINREVEVEMLPTLSPDLSGDLYITVRTGKAGSDYIVNIDGTDYVHSIGNNPPPENLKTDGIAQSLATVINTAALPGVAVHRSGSTLRIVTPNGASASDSSGNSLMDISVGSTQSFDKLPEAANDGDVLLVKGDVDTGDDDYYVRFVADSPTAPLSPGVWEETIGPGLRFQLNPETMPHLFVPDPNVTDGWIYQQAVWADRTAGDDGTAPVPSIVGQTIQDAVYHEGRLCLLAGINLVMSSANDAFNIFRTTSTDLLDDDPIDIDVPNTSGGRAESLVSFDRKLIAFTTREQFSIQGDPVLTPSTVSAQRVTAFDAAADNRPVLAGRQLYFPFKRGRYSGIREYHVADEVGAYDAVDVTGHVDRLIRGPVRQMTASTDANMLAVTSEDDPFNVYVYKWYWDGSRKIQSSWSTYEFGGAVEWIGFDASDLYVILDGYTPAEDEAVSHLARLRHTDEAEDLVHLDRLVASDEGNVTSTFDGTNTTLNLPYVPDPTTLSVVVAADTSLTEGRVLKPVSIDDAASEVVLAGDLTNVRLWVGQLYDFRYRFSPFYVRRQGEAGGSTVVAGLRLQLRRLRLIYDQSGYFDVVVTQDLKPTRTYPFQGKNVGSLNAIINAPSLDSGEFSVPLAGQNTVTRIEIQNSTHLPCRFTSASWEGEGFRRRTR